MFSDRYGLSAYIARCGYGHVRPISACFQANMVTNMFSGRVIFADFPKDGSICLKSAKSAKSAKSS